MSETQGQIHEFNSERLAEFFAEIRKPENIGDGWLPVTEDSEGAAALLAMYAFVHERRPKGEEYIPLRSWHVVNYLDGMSTKEIVADSAVLNERLKKYGDKTTAIGRFVTEEMIDDLIPKVARFVSRYIKTSHYDAAPREGQTNSRNRERVTVPEQMRRRHSKQRLALGKRFADRFGMKAEEVDGFLDMLKPRAEFEPASRQQVQTLQRLERVYIALRQGPQEIKFTKPELTSLFLLFSEHMSLNEQLIYLNTQNDKRLAQVVENSLISGLTRFIDATTKKPRH
jgi:hypothetical protein